MNENLFIKILSCIVVILLTFTIVLVQINVDNLSKKLEKNEQTIIQLQEDIVKLNKTTEND